MRPGIGPFTAAAILGAAGAVASAALLSGCGASTLSNPGQPANAGRFVVPVDAPVVRDRSRHTTTQIADGRNDGQILIIGGASATAGGPVDIAERYDPLAQQFEQTAGNMLVARTQHSATRLDDGTVLVAGGQTLAGTTASAEIYDWLTDRFVAAPGNLLGPRRNHITARVRDGTVLVLGGDAGAAPLGSIERFTIGVGFSAAGTLVQPRTRHRAVVLGNDNVMLFGGFTAAGNAAPTASVEVIDWATGFARAANEALSRPRADAGLAVLLDGRVMIAGGIGAGNVGLDTAEIYDPGQERRSGSIFMTRVRGSARAATLNDGRVLVVGDDNTVDIFDPVNGTFVAGPANLAFPRTGGHSVTRLRNSEILIFGGGAATAIAELFDPRL